MSAIVFSICMSFVTISSQNCMYPVNRAFCYVFCLTELDFVHSCLTVPYLPFIFSYPILLSREKKSKKNLISYCPTNSHNGHLYNGHFPLPPINEAVVGRFDCISPGFFPCSPYFSPRLFPFRPLFCLQTRPLNRPLGETLIMKAKCASAKSSPLFRGSSEYGLIY